MRTRNGRTLFDCVGDWFEELLLREFTDFERIQATNGNNPDFRNSSFQAEAKAGYWHYGAQIKEDQIANFSTPEGVPLIYIIGFHNLFGLTTRTVGMTARQVDTFLDREAGINQVYIISNEIMRRLWGKEHNTSTQDAQWKYFSVKPRHFNSIIENKPLKRGGIRHLPSRWYRIKRPDLLLQPAHSLEGRKSRLEYGLILNKEKDAPVISYLDDKGLIT